jgi:hypothetical protein
MPQSVAAITEFAFAPEKNLRAGACGVGQSEETTGNRLLSEAIAELRIRDFMALAYGDSGRNQKDAQEGDSRSRSL